MVGDHAEKLGPVSPRVSVVEQFKVLKRNDVGSEVNKQDRMKEESSSASEEDVQDALIPSSWKGDLEKDLDLSGLELASSLIEKRCIYLSN